MTTNIFSKIENDHSGILATMKAYRIPYPIAKILIKKIKKEYNYISNLLLKSEVV